MKRAILLALALLASPAHAGDRNFSNPDSNGNLNLKVNKAGTVTTGLQVVGSTAQVSVPNGFVAGSFPVTTTNYSSLVQISSPAVNTFYENPNLRTTIPSSGVYLISAMIATHWAVTMAATADAVFHVTALSTSATPNTAIFAYDLNGGGSYLDSTHNDSGYDRYTTMIVSYVGSFNAGDVIYAWQKVNKASSGSPSITAMYFRCDLSPCFIKATKLSN